LKKAFPQMIASTMREQSVPIPYILHQKIGSFSEIYQKYIAVVRSFTVVSIKQMRVQLHFRIYLRDAKVRRWIRKCHQIDILRGSIMYGLNIFGETTVDPLKAALEPELSELASGT
jgi:hypothetical protein